MLSLILGKTSISSRRLIFRLADEIKRLRAEVGRLRAARPAMVGRIRRAADRYEKDGEPGDLGFVWGWRDIAGHLRREADRLEIAPLEGEGTSRGPGAEVARLEQPIPIGPGATIDRDGVMTISTAELPEWGPDVAGLGLRRSTDDP
jgi:hypothetical protein